MNLLVTCGNFSVFRNHIHHTNEQFLLGEDFFCWLAHKLCNDVAFGCGWLRKSLRSERTSSEKENGEGEGKKAFHLDYGVRDEGDSDG
jgi:hypothetical protein